jgi:hypothetical protein
MRGITPKLRHTSVFFWFRFAGAAWVVGYTSGQNGMLINSMVRGGAKGPEWSIGRRNQYW